MNPATHLEGALLLADAGVQVGPGHQLNYGRCSCKRPTCSVPGRHARIIEGRFPATADPDEIRYLWNLVPSASVIAYPGPTSGVWVLDADDPQALTQLTATIGGLPRTAAVRTSRGQHLYFAWDDRLPANGIEHAFGQLLDYRGPGSYVMAPLSKHPTGAVYVWENRPQKTGFAPAPNALVEMLIP
jgi:hypothetical protein